MQTSVKTKTLGILGGMGSQATSYYFDRIVKSTVASSDQEHIDIILYNHASLPDRTEAILSGKTKGLLSQITEDIKLLESIGANIISIPCNTTHYLIDKIQPQIGIPIINMVNVTVEYAINNSDNINRIGILATNGTLRAKTYENEFIRHGIEVILPSQESQKMLMAVIYDQIKKGKKGNIEVLNHIISELKVKGAGKIILACTELSYLKEYTKLPDYCIDALEILVMKTIEAMGRTYKH